FVEPLESSGLALIYSTAQALVPVLRDAENQEKAIERFNGYIGALYDVIRDFIVMHYCTTDRDDSTFWQDCQQKTLLSEDLKLKLEKWRERLPAEEEYNELVTLNHFNVLCILTGMGFIPKNCKPGISQMSLEKVDPPFERLRRRERHFSEHLPSHQDYLESIKIKQIQ
ncbi:MAG: tryptophan 7-halogenase, partial [bacterium]|nr:tryptophan 7-halogenase [bacterium]